MNKGIAILFMVYYHLFVLHNNLDVTYLSLPDLVVPNIHYYLANFGKICVCIYCFLSGIRAFYSQQNAKNFLPMYKKVLTHLGKFFLNYWIIAMVTIPFAIHTGLIDFNIKSIFYAMLGSVNEIAAMELVKNSLDSRFEDIVKLICECKGKVVITGMGKPGHIGTKIAATMASLGTPSFFLHPAEALHGDLGMIDKKDVVIAISFSGESEEITRLIPSLKLIGATLVGISGNPTSTLISCSDYSFVFPPFKEACAMNLAPTSSTTVALAFGDALAVCASKIYGFNEKNFALFHPAGALGKKLITRVKDSMKTDDENSVVCSGTLLKDAIVVMSKKALGVVNIVDDKKLLGIFTDGDLRRALSKGIDVYNIVIDELMVKTPTTVSSDMMAIEALKIMIDKSISVLPVVDDGNFVGTITINHITGAGIVL